jgi:hypothetical protein
VAALSRKRRKPIGISLEQLENRINPASFAFWNGTLNLSLGDNETASVVSGGSGAYTLSLNSPHRFTGMDLPGLTGNGTDTLSITGQLALQQLQVEDNLSTGVSHGVVFNPSANAYGIGVGIAFTSANGSVTVSPGTANTSTAFSGSFGLTVTGVNRVRLEPGSNLSTADGPISLTTATYDASASGAGVSLGADSALHSTGYGSILINATASTDTKSSGYAGLEMAQGAAIVTANGPVTLIAKAAGDKSSRPADITVASGSVVTAGGGSTLLFQSDTLSIDSQVSTISSPTGTIQFQTLSPDREISLGAGGGGLSLDQKFLNGLTAAGLSFGGAGYAGTLSNTEALAPAKAGNINFQTTGKAKVGAAITASGGISLTGDKVEIHAPLDTAASGNGGGVVIVATTGVVDILPAGTITSGGPVDITAGTQINTAGNISAPGSSVTYHSKVVLTGSVNLDTRQQGPFSIPIYQMNNNGAISFAIYASINGGPMVPYLLDTGSPNFFPTYGSWWPGAEAPTASTPRGQYTQTYASGAQYTYNIANVSVSLGNNAGGALTPPVQANVGQIITTGDQTPLEYYNTWASKYAQGQAPFGDNTFGNFGAGLYGSSTLATILAQLPLAPGLKPGFIVRSGGNGSPVGELIVGLSPDAISAFPDPMTMDPSGNNLPNAFGLTVKGYGAAQVANTEVVLTKPDGTTYKAFMPSVWDTGGGPNNVIYQDQTGPNAVPGTFLLDSSAQGGQVVGGVQYTVLNGQGAPAYELNTGKYDNVNKTVVDPSYNVGVGFPRLNPGVAPFLTHDVMYNLGDGTLGLARSGVTIPLQLVNIGSDTDPSYKLGIYVGLGGGPPMLYEFDTGAAGFFAAYDPHNPELTSWWAPDSFTDTGKTLQMSYTSGMEYFTNVVNTQVSLYASNASGAQPIFTLPEQPMVAQIQDAQDTKDSSYDYFALLREGKAPVEGHFYGDFGMALYANGKANTSTEGTIYAILPQAGPVNGRLGNGFIIRTGGYNGAIPMVQVGLGALDRARFRNLSVMNPPMGSIQTSTFPVGGGPTFDFALTNGLVTLGSDSGLLTQAMPLVMDTGAPKSVLHAFGTIAAPSSAVTSLDLTIPGLVPTDGLFTAMAFQPGKPHSLNGFAEDTTPNTNTPNGYLNTGINLFFRNDVMYDLQNQRVGFYGYPAQAAGGVNFLSTVDGAYDLTIQAGAGTVSIVGAAGAATPLTGLTVQQATGVALADVHAGQISVTSSAATLSGHLDAGKSLQWNVQATQLATDVKLTAPQTITVTGTLDSAHSQSTKLTLDGGASGTVQINGLVGSITPLGGLVVANGQAVTFAQGVTVTGGTGQIAVQGATSSVTFAGNVTASSLTGGNALSAYALNLSGTQNTVSGSVSLATYQDTVLGAGNLSAGAGLLLGATRLTLTLNGPSAGEFSTMTAGQALRIGGTVLSLTSPAGFVGETGTVFQIIDNQSSAGVVGTFAGLPEGAVVPLNGMNYAISYTGGDGNDVVLTCVRQLPTPSGPQVAAPFSLARGATVASLGNGQVGIWSATGAYQAITPFPGYSGPLTVNTVNRAGGPNSDSIFVGVAGRSQPHVVLIDAATGRVGLSLYAFAEKFLGGVNVAGGLTQINGTATTVLLCGAGSGSAPSVSVFDAVTGDAMGAFYAFAGPFQGGVRVALSQPAAGGSSLAIVGSSVNSHVVAFDLSNYNASVLSFYAFQGQSTPFGVYVASGDLNGDNQNEIVVGAGQGSASPQVSIFSSTGSPLSTFKAFSPGYAGGVRVGLAYDTDGNLDILAASGEGSRATLNIFGYPDLDLLDAVFLSDSLQGAYVASNYSQSMPSVV